MAYVVGETGAELSNEEMREFAGQAAGLHGTRSIRDVAGDAADGEREA